MTSQIAQVEPTFAAAASASRFFRTRSSTLNGVGAGFFPHPTFFFFGSTGGGAGGASSGGGGGADTSGGGGGAAESSGGGGGGVGGRSIGSGEGSFIGSGVDPSGTKPSMMVGMGCDDMMVVRSAMASVWGNFSGAARCVVT